MGRTGLGWAGLRWAAREEELGWMGWAGLARADLGCAGLVWAELIYTALS